MTISVVALSKSAQLDEVLDMTYPTWHDGLSRAAYGRWYTTQLATPWGSRHLSRWALVEDGAVLASAKVYALAGRLEGRPLRIHGIGAVFVAPAQRGRGLGVELMNRLVERAGKEGADAVLLFSEIGAAYYARLGFEIMPMDDLTLRVREDERRGAPATMVRFGDDRDLPDVIEMDASRAAAFRFHLDRDRDMASYALTKKRLLAGLAPAGARALQFFVAEEGASAVAYVVIAVKERGWTIESCGDRDPAGARLGAILQVLIAREPGEQRPAIGGWLPATLRPRQIEVVSAAPSRDVMMIRPLTAAARASRPLRAEDIFYWRGDSF